MIDKKEKYRVLGLMSGTSLDGLDIADCSFEFQNNQWSFEIHKAKTYAYPNDISEKLSLGIDLGEKQVSNLSDQLAIFFSEKCLEMGVQGIDFIASHGHTIFHQPEKGITVQIGNPQFLADMTKKTVVADFRSLDVSLGGQGAPLVPIGDRELFSEYDGCINLGGFANISMENSGRRIAWDICPVNVLLNHLAKKLGMKYDNRGDMARQGIVNNDLLDKLNHLSYYKKSGPRSLGMEWVKKEVMPLLNSDVQTKDILTTCTEHAAFQIARNLKKNKSYLFTGGGAYNNFLMERIRLLSESQVNIPDNLIIEYKEALIFAFLSVLRSREEINTLCSVTGASRDSSGGVIFTPI